MKKESSNSITTSSQAVDGVTKHKRFVGLLQEIWRDNWNNLNTDVAERKENLTKYKIIDWSSYFKLSNLKP
jgi:hypothetical protein